jgi:hypothetical protein
MDRWLSRFWRGRFALVGGPQALAASAKGSVSPEKTL